MHEVMGIKVYNGIGNSHTTPEREELQGSKCVRDGPDAARAVRSMKVKSRISKTKTGLRGVTSDYWSNQFKPRILPPQKAGDSRLPT